MSKWCLCSDVYVQIGIETDYNVDEYYNKLTGETIDMKKLDKVQYVEAFLPFDQIIVEEEDTFSALTS